MNYPGPDRKEILDTTLRTLFGIPPDAPGDYPATYGDYWPSSLPEISGVDVVLLLAEFGGPSEEKKGRFQGYRALKTTKLGGARAQKIARLWRYLPMQAGGMRCHSPGYGLRFHTEEGPLLEATICWRCFNVYLTTNEGEIHGFAFQALSNTAQTLLHACLKNGFPHPLEMGTWMEIGISKLTNGMAARLTK